jgi:hypothetical protein
MTGQFKNCKVPDDIIYKLVYKHSKSGTMQELDKMVKQLNWSEYKYLAELE